LVDADPLDVDRLDVDRPDQTLMVKIYRGGVMA
jgi:hypothetical protein